MTANRWEGIHKLTCNDPVGGAFVIRERLGQGGTAIVFEAHDRELNRQVAIKLPTSERGAQLVVEEGRALAGFNTPGLPTVYGIRRHVGLPFLIMERLHGRTLDLVIQTTAQDGLPWEEAVQYVRQIANALVVLHRANLAHRDLKPENTMVCPGGRVVLIDLGISRTEGRIHEDHEIAGTPAYMAPESIRGMVKPGQAHLVDVYALGAIAYELLTGRPAYDAKDIDALLDLHVNAPPPRIRGRLPDVPCDLEELVVQMLAKDPLERPESIDTVLASLRAISEGRTISREKRATSVLFVDDDPDFRELMEICALQLERDINLRVAKDGVDALRQFRAHAPDLLVADLDMPEMNGLELCLHLQGMAQHTTIAVLSSHAKPAEQALLSRLGVVDFLDKPNMDLDDLLAKLDELVARAQL